MPTRKKDDGQRKREVYAARACLVCRRRKAKCIRTIDVDEGRRCQRCVAMGTECVMMAVKRGRRHSTMTTTTEEEEVDLQDAVVGDAFYPLPVSRASTSTVATPVSSLDERTQQDVCRFGRPQWRFKQTIIRLSQYAKLYKEAKSSVRQLGQEDIGGGLKALQRWNPFLWSFSKDDLASPSSFKAKVVRSILLDESGDDLDHVQKQATALLLGQSGEELEDVEALLLLALYAPFDLHPDVKKDNVPPGLGLLNACRSMLANLTTTSAPSFEQRLTTYAVFVAHTMIAINRENPAVDLMSAPPLEEEMMDAFMIAEAERRHWPQGMRIALSALLHRVRLCRRIAHGWQSIAKLDFQDRLVIGRLRTLVEDLFQTVDKDRWKGDGATRRTTEPHEPAPYGGVEDEEECFEETMELWLHVEVNDCLASFPPRLGWMVSKRCFHITPTPRNFNDILGRMKDEDREHFFELNRLNGAFHSLGPLASLVLLPNATFSHRAPTIFTLSRLLAAAEGVVETNAIRLLRGETLAYDVVQGNAAHMRICAKLLPQTHPLFRITSMLLSSFAKIAVQSYDQFSRNGDANGHHQTEADSDVEFSLEALLNSDLFDLAYSDILP